MNESEMLSNVEFNDITLIEGNGDYKKICSIMEGEHLPKWMLETSAIITCFQNSNGQKIIISEANLKLQFFNDGIVKITSYATIVPDPMFSPDIRYLKSYLTDKGWKRIEPHIYLVDENLMLWKTLWETGMVESDYLEKRFGPREFYEEEENSDG